MIWIISSILWYEGMLTPQKSDYLLKSFTTKADCQQFITENKVLLIEQLLKEMKEVDGFKLQTFEYFCKKEDLLEA